MDSPTPAPRSADLGRITTAHGRSEIIWYHFVVSATWVLHPNPQSLVKFGKNWKNKRAQLYQEDLLFAVLDIMCGVPYELVMDDLRAAQAHDPASHGPQDDGSSRVDDHATGAYVYQHSAPFTRWVQQLYLGHHRTVKVNGVTTDWFSLQSSVPQGCILASQIYVVFINVLGVLLRTDPAIKGIELPSGDHIVAPRFADDTLTIVQENSIARSMDVVEIFNAASGGVNNCDKTEGMWAGALRYRQEPWEGAAFKGVEVTATDGMPRLLWLPPGSTVRLLGVNIGYDVDAMPEWLGVASKMLTCARM